MAFRRLIYYHNTLNKGFSSNSINSPGYYTNLLIRNPTFKFNVKHSFRTNAIKYNNGLVRSPTPFEGLPAGPNTIHSFNLFKSFVFSVAFSTGSFVAVSIWEYEQIRSRALKTLKNSIPFTWFKHKLQNGQKQMNTWQKGVDSWWNTLSQGEKIFAPLCALNLIVFGLWRISRLQPVMLNYFCSNPAGRAICWPMVLSTFSHYSAFHIFANMYVLHSFANGAVATLGKEQFLGLYLTAGVFSAFASYLYKGLSKRGGLSLGASGAIMGILAYVCTQYPNTQLSIIFLPMYPFTAGIAIKCIMGLDLAGLLLGWRYFDHAAHLGGALVGLFWCYYGSQYLWPKRERLLREYHKIRSPPPK